METILEGEVKEEWVRSALNYAGYPLNQWNIYEYRRKYTVSKIGTNNIDTRSYITSEVGSIIFNSFIIFLKG